MSCPRYLMIGGFLGAGKTTAILRLAEQFRTAGQRVGLITNDQSFGLVDTQLLASRNLNVEEITGGCFCCRFNSLVEAAEKLSTDHAPDVFLAEPVGSCTDLKATVDYPLRQLYGDAYSIAPFSVLVDPVRAARVLGLRTDKSFSEKVLYIYQKQLEEADLIVINKTDLIGNDERAELEQALLHRFPGTLVHGISAREGTGIREWLDQLNDNVARTSGAMAVDYDLYAEGEALLGWLNAQFQLTAASEFDGNRFLSQLAARFCESMQGAAIEIAHLKMTLTPDQGGDIAVINVVRNDLEPEMSHRLQAPLSAGELTVNLRAQGDSQVIRELAEGAFAIEARICTLEGRAKHVESFSPGRPVPTHRMESV